MPLGKGWIGEPRRQGGSWEEGVGHEIVGGDEEGEEGAVGVGEERQLPHDIIKIVPVKNTNSYFVFLHSLN